MKDKIHNLTFLLLTSAAGIAADQYTKKLAVDHLMGKEPIVWISGVFELLYTENRGAAFGMMQGMQVLFFLIAAAVLIASAWIMWRLPGFQAAKYTPFKICVACIASGAIGNMIDRLGKGYVVDFLYFRLIDFPVFNVADIFVTCATGVMILLLLFYYKDEELEQLLAFGKGGSR